MSGLETGQNTTPLAESRVSTPAFDDVKRAEYPGLSVELMCVRVWSRRQTKNWSSRAVRELSQGADAGWDCALKTARIHGQPLKRRKRTNADGYTATQGVQVQCERTASGDGRTTVTGCTPGVIASRQSHDN